MAVIPIPSHIHYELLLQILERQTLSALDHQSSEYQQLQEVIIHLRKALVGQKHLEESCQRAGHTVEHRWALNQQTPVERSESP